MRILEQLRQDLDYAARGMRRSPGFAVIAVAILALGIAAAVTVFSFVDAVFLRRLPVAGSERLVRIEFVNRNGGGEGTLGFPATQWLRANARSFDFVAAHYSTAPFYVRAGGESREISGAVVSADYFRMLGVEPQAGRFFVASEDSVPDRDPVAVIGDALWRGQFAGDPAILGRRIIINDRSFQIVGVAPAGFFGVLQGMSPNEIWIPTAMLRVGYRWCDAFAASPPCRITHALARLRPGTTLEQAGAEVAALSRQLIAFDDARDSARTVIVTSAVGVRSSDRDQYRRVAQLLGAIAAILLAVACTNLGGLLLARGVAREREIALRTALGAGRSRLVRQMLTEALLIGIAGGVVGVVLSAWSTESLMTLFSGEGDGYVRRFDVGLDATALAVGLGVSLATVLAFGVLPAVQLSRSDLARLIRGDVGRDRTRLRMMLVSAQVALSMVLLVGAGLLMRSFAQVSRWSRFDAEHVTLLRVRPRLVSYAPARAQRFLREMTTRLRESPDVDGVAFARGTGGIWESTGQLSVGRPGDAQASPRGAPRVDYHEISPRFFATLRVPVLAGREFVDADSAGTPRVAIVNETLARRLWPEGSAVGEPLVLGDTTLRVVGVVRNHRLYPHTAAAPAMAFVPFWQNVFEPNVDARLAVRVRGDPRTSIAWLRRAISAVDPQVPVTETLPMTAQVTAHFADVRLGGRVLFAASVLTLFLSAIGLYGVMASVVGRRTREIGIRMAIGARRPQVMMHFLRQALRATWIGGAVGIVGALAGAHFLGSWLVGVTPTDPAAFAIALTSIGFMALLASYLPARQASRVDPAVAMRAE